MVSWLLLRQLGSRQSYEPAIEIEGLGRAAFALVANGDTYTYLGRFGLRFAPEARFELGLDVVAPVRFNTRGLPGAVWGALRGLRNDAGFLYAHDRDRIEIVCDASLPLQADGEDLGDVEAVLFECERAALPVLI